MIGHPLKSIPVGIPTALSERETICLQKWADGKRVVEAGALLGYSTIRLAQVAAHVVSIDRHLDYTIPTLRTFRANLERAGVAGKVEVIVECALSALPRFRGDFGFIDLTGCHRLTRAALEAIQTPVVGVHDFGRVGCSGVEPAIKQAGFEVIEIVDSLAIVGRPK